MTNQHPLTDDIAEVIANPARWPDDLGDVVFTYDDMRAAADWQLERVKEEVKRELKIWRKSGYIAGADAAEDFFEGVIQTMRP